MFDVGQIVLMKITQAKVMILGSVKSPAIGDKGENVDYVVRLPTYQVVGNVHEYELEPTKE